MKKINFVPLFVFVFAGCVSKIPPKLNKTVFVDRAAVVDLEAWIPKRIDQSWVHLQNHISPKDPKVAGGPRPLPGVVVASFSKKDPDYYFHWIRDSSTVMHSVLDLSKMRPDLVPTIKRDQLFTDYFNFTRKIQFPTSKEGIGEPRYTIEGKADTLPWSRPQYDGLGLRALTVIEYIESLGGVQSTNEKMAYEVLTKDLEGILKYWNSRGFDIWEEYNAENFHTRLAHLVALEKATALGTHKKHLTPLLAKMKETAKKIESQLNDHWDPARGFFKSQLAIVATDGYTAKQTDLDSAVVLAVMETNRENSAFNVEDDRVEASVKVLEDLFAQTYPINAKRTTGLLYGRYKGDVYYEGNPWPMITATYAGYYYRLASRLNKLGTFVVTKRNLKFARGLLGDTVEVGLTLKKDSAQFKSLIAALKDRADQIYARLQTFAPADGTLAEQFDKTTGESRSAHDLAWSHSALLSSLYERSVFQGSER